MDWADITDCPRLRIDGEENGPMLLYEDQKGEKIINHGLVENLVLDAIN